MSTRRNGKAYRRASWLAVLAVLFQALLPSVHDAGMAFAAPADGVAALTDISHHLCLAPGDQTPDTPKAPAHLGQLCTLCTAAHAVTHFAPPPAPAVLDARNCIAVVPAATGKHLPCRPLSHGPQQPRGPPALI